MKKFTTKEQTQHLIKLGFPRPCSISDFEEIVDHQGTTFIHDLDYSIGDLIEFLGDHLLNIKTYPLYDYPISYGVRFTGRPESIAYKEVRGELIDKLYEACVELKHKALI